MRFEIVHRVFGVLATGDFEYPCDVAKLFAGVFRMLERSEELSVKYFHIVKSVYTCFSKCQALTLQ